MPAETVLETWLRGFAAQASTDDVVAEFVRQIDERITSQIPEIAADPMLVQDMHESTGAQWRAFLASLTSEHALVVPPAASDLARSLARRGHDLGILLKIYRDAQQAVFSFFTEVTDSLDESGPPRDEVLKFMWNRAGQWINDTVEQLIETFYAEREQLAEGALHRRSQLIEELLRNAGADVDVDRASRDLGHPVAHWQTACVLWSTRAETSEFAQSLLDLARQVSAALGVATPLTLMAGTRDLWFWVPTPTRPDLAALAALAPILDGAGVRLATGIPAVGLAGFRTSHTEARAAQRVGLAAPVPPAVLPYTEVELICLLTGNPELVERMVLREVGPLCTAEKNLAQVRETALAYLVNGLNVEATAQQLFVHKNTVRYRLTRAEELLGHPLSARSAIIEVALRHVALMGPPTG